MPTKKKATKKKTTKAKKKGNVVDTKLASNLFLLALRSHKTSDFHANGKMRFTVSLSELVQATQGWSTWHWDINWAGVRAALCGELKDSDGTVTLDQVDAGEDVDFELSVNLYDRSYVRFYASFNGVQVEKEDDHLYDDSGSTVVDFADGRNTPHPWTSSGVTTFKVKRTVANSP